MNHLNAALQPQGLQPPPVPTSQRQQHARLNQQQQHHHQTFPQHTQAQSQQHPYPLASPHQLQSTSASPGPYVPSQSHVSLQSQYAAQPQSSLLHQPGDPGFFNPHPSPFSTNSAAGSFTSADAAEAMAQATMSRQTYPPIPNLQTPQSQSPASMHSPHHDPSGRAMYGYPPMAGAMYYPPSYPVHAVSTFSSQAPSASHNYPPVSSSPGMMLHHSNQHGSYAPQPQLHAQGQMDIKPLQPPLQRPPTAMALPPPPTPQPQVPAQHSTPQTPQSASMQGLTLGSSAGTSSAAAPGPIPATTPLVVRQDQNGVQWILFEYSRDRVKMEYTIRCDVESVKVEELSQEFKSANCVYPRACGAKENYKGNRLTYESECNAVGWALAQLNPSLREKRGLIQRAVDSWRNSNRDPRLRSRRVRRQAKVLNRKQQAAQTQPMAGPSNMTMQAPQMAPSRSGSIMQHAPHMHHHGDMQDHRGVDGSEGQYHGGPAVQQHQMHPSNSMASPVDVRYTQQFYPQFPQQPVAGSAQLPSGHGGISMSHAPSSSMASMRDEDDEESSRRALFGDIPESKRRKFILVEDNQRGTRVRVRVMLDQVKMDDMPDAHLRINAVYPRSFYPRHMCSPSGSPRSRGIWEHDDEAVDGDHRGKTFVPVRTVDGTEIQLPVPRLTKSRRANEVALNELGQRMSWGQARTFNGRTLFLQRSLDAYRGKIRHSMAVVGSDPEAIAPHFELRPGKRKLAERGKRERRDSHAS